MRNIQRDTRAVQREAARYENVDPREQRSSSRLASEGEMKLILLGKTAEHQATKRETP